MPVSGHEVPGALMNPDPFENFERLLEARTRAELTPYPYRKESPLRVGRTPCL